MSWRGVRLTYRIEGIIDQHQYIHMENVFVLNADENFFINYFETGPRQWPKTYGKER